MTRCLGAVLALVLGFAPASAQVRSVPVSAGRAPLVPFSGFNENSVPSLSNFALPAPSLSASFSPAPGVALSENAVASLASPISLAAVQPLALKAAVPAAAAPARPALAAAPSALAAAISPAAFVPADGKADVQVQAAKLDALYDGSAPRSGSAAATPEGPGPSRREPLFSPKTIRRAKTVAAIAIPVAAAAAGLGAAAPSFALTVMHWLGQGAYWLANPFAFAFTLPQIHRMLSRRSAAISTSMTVVGLLSTAAMAVNMAFDGKDLMLYRNLAQAAGFAVMLYLQRRLAKRAGDRPLPSKRRAILETAGAVLAMGAAMAVAGPLLSAAIPGIAAMSGLLVPIQIVAGFGFTYLMYAQLTKMQREHSAGDSSPAMMWAYLGTKSIWLWSFAMMVGLAGGAPWLALSMGTLFIGLCWFAGQFALSRLLHSPWSFLPEKVDFRGRTLTRATMADAIAFAALSALILGLSGLGWLAYSSFVGVPAAASSRFLMYLLYTVQSLVACLATLRTLRMRKELDGK